MEYAHSEEDGQIISHETIERSIDGGEAYRIVCNGQNVGGVTLKAEGERGDLEILFVSPNVHRNCIGYAAWREAEKLHPEVKVRETVTPYFEKRNIYRESENFTSIRICQNIRKILVLL